MNRAAEFESAALPEGTTSGIVAKLGALLDGKKTLAGARGISRAALDSFYGITRELYVAGHRAEALSNLEMLCLYDHENARYWQALGTCRQANKDHLGAAAAFGFAIGLSNQFNGSLELQLVENLLAAGHADAAGVRLREALEAAGKEPANESWHAKAGRLQAQLAESAPTR